MNKHACLKQVHVVKAGLGLATSGNGFTAFNSSYFESRERKGQIATQMQ